MKKTATASEWTDYQDFRVEYAREVLCSCDPASILHSDVGQYEWVSGVFAERIADRARKYGKSDELFGDPKKRHLVQLTYTQQRLSKALEGSTSNDMAFRVARRETFERLRRRELALSCAQKGQATHILDRGAVTERAISRLCLNPIVSECCKGAHAPAVGDRIDVVKVAIDELLAVKFFFEARIEKQSSNVSGAIFPRVYADVPGTSRSLPRLRKDGFVFFHQAFFQGLTTYSRFESYADLLVCCAAWGEVLLQSVRCIHVPRTT